MTTKNPFIKTVNKRKVTEGKRKLIGGIIFSINQVGENFVFLSLYHEGELGKEICLSDGSLEELAAILTEIAEVMKENK